MNSEFAGLFCRLHHFGRILSLGMLILLGGCGPEFPLLQRMKPLPGDSVCRVAVLPFVSECDYPLADAIAHKVFLGKINSLDISFVAQEGDVRKLYQQFRIYPGQLPSPEQLKILANRLNVQLLFIGHVLEMRENPAPNKSVDPLLVMRLEIIDGRTAETLWSTYHRRQGLDYQKVMHFGQINSVTSLCHQVSQEIITLWLEKGLTTCDVSPGF